MSTKDCLKAYLWEKRISQAKFAESIGVGDVAPLLPMEVERDIGKSRGLFLALRIC